LVKLIFKLATPAHGALPLPPFPLYNLTKETFDRSKKKGVLMPIYQSQIKSTDSIFLDNKAHLEKLASELQERLQVCRKGGGEKAVEKHKSRGKMTARERIKNLIDDQSSFLELAPLAAFDMYDGQAPCAGVVAGIGKIQGSLCMIVANDATVKGGTYFPMTVKKHLRAQEVALENNLPCIYLVDSGGAFLPLQSEVFPDKEHFGRIFYNQARLSAKGIPQISVVMGSCTAGGAYVPAMSDENVIVKENGTIFLGGPPLVKAATGEVVSAQELGGAHVHTELSGVCDHFAENDEDALNITKDIVSHLNIKKTLSPNLTDYSEPLYPASELYGIVPKDPRQPFDIKEVILRIVDGSNMHEFKENYGKSIVTCFAKICGMNVGIVANNGILFSESSLKAAHFVELCDQRGTPIIFVQNITGFMVGKEYETGGIAKDGAKLVTAVSNARVPKITLVVGGSHGAGNYGMCGRAYQPRFMWTWPNSKISVMGGEQAANVLWTVKKDQLESKGQSATEEMEKEFKAPILNKYEKESSSYYATARLWDDGVIDPKDTRKVLALSLHACLNSKMEEPVQSIFRM
jgi:3-methylcrotonyl-CoA carboxylase beta subunit